MPPLDRDRYADLAAWAESDAAEDLEGRITIRPPDAGPDEEVIQMLRRCAEGDEELIQMLQRAEAGEG